MTHRPLEASRPKTSVNEASKTIPPSPIRLLNFGCGSTWHPKWVNLDALAVDPDVIVHDLRDRMPFLDDTFDAAYGSHVLEHLDPAAGMRLLRECHRILRPRGILRIVVPDLEGIARLYLDSLEKAANGDIDAVFRHDWAMIELYDQAVRTASGGMMAARLRGGLDDRQARFVEGRIGAEAMNPGGSASAGQGVSSRGWSGLLRAAERALRRHAARVCTWVFLGRDGAAALNEGLFRRSGEVHQWMYDRFSLKRALEQAGFTRVRICAAEKSGIPGFADYGLDLRNGKARKPDSIYVEGLKPGVA